MSLSNESNERKNVALVVPKTQNDFWLRAEELEPGVHMTNFFTNGAMRSARLDEKADIISSHRACRSRRDRWQAGRADEQIDILLVWTIFCKDSLAKEWVVYRQRIKRDTKMYVFTPIGRQQQQSISTRDETNECGI